MVKMASDRPVLYGNLHIQMESLPLRPLLARSETFESYPIIGVTLCSPSFPCACSALRLSSIRRWSNTCTSTSGGVRCTGSPNATISRTRPHGAVINRVIRIRYGGHGITEVFNIILLDYCWFASRPSWWGSVDNFFLRCRIFRLGIILWDVFFACWSLSLSL